MINEGGIFAYWNPQKGISGSANPGRVWVDSINSVKGTAIIRFDANTGMRSRAFSARLVDLVKTASGYKPGF